MFKQLRISKEVKEKTVSKKSVFPEKGTRRKKEELKVAEDEDRKDHRTMNKIERCVLNKQNVKSSSFHVRDLARNQIRRLMRGGDD